MQCRCPSTDKWIKKLWYIYTMEYHSAIKRNAFEAILMRWTNLEPIIQVKSEREEQISYINAYIWNLERWYWLFAWQQWSCRHREQTCGHSVGRGGSGRIERVTLNIYITTRKIDSQFVVWCGELKPRRSVGTTKRSGMGWEERRSFKREGTNCWFMLMYSRN